MSLYFCVSGNYSLGRGVCVCSEQQTPGNWAYRSIGKDRKVEDVSSTYSGSKRLDKQPWTLHLGDLLVPQIHCDFE